MAPLPAGGGSSGIGLATSRQLSQAGASLVIGCRRPRCPVSFEASWIQAATATTAWGDSGEVENAHDPG